MGLEVFTKNCESCHSVLWSSRNKTSFPFYHNNSFGNQNIGLSFLAEENGDNGWGFRVPNLRNIEYTAPYMHDGRFETLREVIDHYDSGVISNPRLSWQLVGVDGRAKQMNLTETEKEALEKFLLTLSDETLLVDEKFSNPYQ